MPRLLLACIAAVALGCGTAEATPEPNAAIWTPPPDWVTVSNQEGSIQLTLPPYILPSDTYGAIFANEPPPNGGGEIPVQIWAEGPLIGGAPRHGEDLVAWVEQRLESPVKGLPTVTRVSLPAGSGIRYDRLDGFGTAQPWRIVVFALETQRGVGWLMIDGPSQEWAARADDLERVPPLFRVR